MIKSRFLSSLALAFGLMITCSGTAQELGDFLLPENDHAGWRQIDVFVSPDKPTLSFGWGFNVNAYHGQGRNNYVIWQNLSVGYNTSLGSGPDRGCNWSPDLWSRDWHYVGSESASIPPGGFTGHQDLNLGALAGQPVSLWFYLDYLGNDYGNDSTAVFCNIEMVPEPASHDLLALGLCDLAILKRNQLRRFLAGPRKLQPLPLPRREQNRRKNHRRLDL